MAREGAGTELLLEAGESTPNICLLHVLRVYLQGILSTAKAQKINKINVISLKAAVVPEQVLLQQQPVVATCPLGQAHQMVCGRGRPEMPHLEKEGNELAVSRLGIGA